MTKSALSKALDDVGDKILENKLAHGWEVTGQKDWEDTHQIPAVLMLIVTEVSEAMEAFRKNDKENFEEEMADIVIRVVGLAHGLGIDLGDAVHTKMIINKVRKYQHGGKRI